ncbi:hypothetical protein UlMin_039993 [Ulmus minor]
MALEQVHLPTPNPVDGENDGGNNGVDVRPPSTDGGDDGSKAPRLPRWTRQEILVLIQGKRVAESKVRRIRTAGAAFGSGQVEPKWASVSSYCKVHGVNRGPVQCRKRWSNLAGDYKKIKEWESQRKDGSDSFWAMRNDLRRERKLPGFFDKEVYDILDSGSGGQQSSMTVVTPAPVEEEKEGGTEERDDTGALFSSLRGATADDGMFSDFEQDESGRSSDKEGGPKEGLGIPIGIPATPISGAGTGEKEKQPASTPNPHPNPETGSTSQDQGRKRKRLTTDADEENSLQTQLIDVLDRNGKVLATHLEAQNNHFQLDREQRKHHSDSLVAVLNKLADALVRISDKL